MFGPVGQIVAQTAPVISTVAQGFGQGIGRGINTAATMMGPAATNTVSVLRNAVPAATAAALPGTVQSYVPSVGAAFGTAASSMIAGGSGATQQIGHVASNVWNGLSSSAAVVPKTLSAAAAPLISSMDDTLTTSTGVLQNIARGGSTLANNWADDIWLTGINLADDAMATSDEVAIGGAARIAPNSASTSGAVRAAATGLASSADEITSGAVSLAGNRLPSLKQLASESIDSLMDKAVNNLGKMGGAAAARRASLSSVRSMGPASAGQASSAGRATATAAAGSAGREGRSGWARFLSLTKRIMKTKRFQFNAISATIGAVSIGVGVHLTNEGNEAQLNSTEEARELASSAVTRMVRAEEILNITQNLAANASADAAKAKGYTVQIVDATNKIALSHKELTKLLNTVQESLMARGEVSLLEKVPKSSYRPERVEFLDAAPFYVKNELYLFVQVLGTDGRERAVTVPIVLGEDNSRWEEEKNGSANSTHDSNSIFVIAEDDVSNNDVESNFPVVRYVPPAQANTTTSIRSARTSRSAVLDKARNERGAERMTRSANDSVTCIDRKGVFFRGVLKTLRTFRGDIMKMDLTRWKRGGGDAPPSVQTRQQQQSDPSHQEWRDPNKRVVSASVAASKGTDLRQETEDVEMVDVPDCSSDLKVQQVTSLLNNLAVTIDDLESAMDVSEPSQTGQTVRPKLKAAPSAKKTGGYKGVSYRY